MARKQHHPKPMAASTGARDTVLKALPDRTAPLGVTARELAEATGLRYSTVTEQLRVLAAQGLAVKSDSDEGATVTTWRFNSDSVDARMARTQSSAAATTPHDGDEASSGEVDAVRDYLQRARPVSPAPAGAANAPRGERVRSERAVAAGFESTWGRGGLRDAVLELVRALPEGESVTPTVAAKALNAQVGSVAAALEAMAKRGEVRRTVDKPKTYAAV